MTVAFATSDHVPPAFCSSLSCCLTFLVTAFLDLTVSHGLLLGTASFWAASSAASDAVVEPASSSQSKSYSSPPALVSTMVLRAALCLIDSNAVSIPDFRPATSAHNPFRSGISSTALLTFPVLPDDVAK